MTKDSVTELDKMLLKTADCEQIIAFLKILEVYQPSKHSNNTQNIQSLF